MRRTLPRLAVPSVVALLLALVLFAPTAWAQGQEVTVSMEDNYFDRADITVEPGTTVTWVQNGDNPHTSTSYDGLWDSGLIQGGAEGSVSYTFEEPGTYGYFCGPHEDQGMVGTVTVAGDGGADAGGQGQLADTGGPPLLVVSGAVALSGFALLAFLRRRAS